MNKEILDEINESFYLLEDYDENDSEGGIEQARSDYNALNKLIVNAEKAVDFVTENNPENYEEINKFIDLRNRAIDQIENLESKHPDLHNIPNYTLPDMSDNDEDQFTLNDFIAPDEETPVNKASVNEEKQNIPFFDENDFIPSVVSEKENSIDEDISEKFISATDPNKRALFISNEKQVKLLVEARKINGYQLKDLNQNDFNVIKSRSSFLVENDENRKVFLMLHFSGKIDAFNKYSGEDLEEQFKILNNSGSLKRIADATFKDKEAKELAEKRIAFLDIVSKSNDVRDITVMSSSSLIKSPIISNTVKEENEIGLIKSLKDNNIKYDTKQIASDRLFFDKVDDLNLYKDVIDNREELQRFKVTHSVLMLNQLKDPDYFKSSINAFDKNTENVDSDSEYQRRGMFSDLVKAGVIDFQNIEQRYALYDKDNLSKKYNEQINNRGFELSVILYEYANSVSEDGEGFVKAIKADFNKKPFLGSIKIAEELGLKEEIINEVDFKEISNDKDIKDKKSFENSLKDALKGKEQKVDVDTEHTLEEITTNSLPSLLSTPEINALFPKILKLKQDGLTRTIELKECSIFERPDGLQAQANDSKRETLEHMAASMIKIAKAKGWGTIEIEKISRVSETLYVHAISAGLKVVPKNKEQEQLFTEYHRKNSLPGLPGHGAKVEEDLAGIVKYPSERYIRDQNIANTDAKKLHIPATKLRSY